MAHKAFPQVASLPTIKINTINHESIPLRTVEVDNIRNLAPYASPYAKRISTSENKMPRASTVAGEWTPISVSSDEEDEEEDEEANAEKRDRVNHQLRDLQLPIVMKKQPSLLSLRNRRNPRFHGVRTIRPARVINKSGDGNVGSVNVPEKSMRFFKDLVNTLVEAQWRYVLLFFAFAFFGSWLFFAVFYWIIAWSHGDMEFDEETGQRLGMGSSPCIMEAKTFAGFFLFSVESQVSTGYGTWFPTEECPEAIFVLIVQLIFGLVIDAAVVGIFYVKIIRPPKYADFKFSKKAVICQRDSRLCLLFRVADFKLSHAIDTKIRAYLFEERVTAEGERVGKCQERVRLENNGRVFLIWPQIICHVIDSESPFYDMSAKDLLERRFELIATMTGVSKNTGQLAQARTSYLSTEMLWGYRFTNIINYDREAGHYVTNIDRLDEVEQVDTALCSAHRLAELQQELSDFVERETLDNSCSHLNQGTMEEEQEEDESDSDDDGGIHMAR